MNNTAKTAADTVIATFNSDQTIFTAYDVTRKIRDKGEKAYHSEIRDLVTNTFNNGSITLYDRTSVDLGGGIQALVYHPNGTDPNSYDKDWIDNDPTQAKVKTAATTAPAASGYTPLSDLDDDEDDDEDEDDLTSKTDSVHVGSVSVTGTPGITKEGRLQIPINIVKSAGLYPAQDIFVHTVNLSKIEIRTNRLDKSDYALTVNKDCRIRLSKNIIFKRLGVCPSYQIDEDDGTISVTS
tara:strand:- start:532 stop:1248 length:717 start_codon:yes stop_codon:yes gene_type:complete